MTRLLLIDAKYEKPIRLTRNLKDSLLKHKPKSIALFASVQFSDLNDLINDLRKLKIKTLTTKAKRTDDKIQILGCDCYPDSFKDDIIKEADLILYVGDGLFHPKALLLSQMNEKIFKSVLLFDPIQDKINLIDKDTIKRQLQKAIRNIRLFLNAGSIGILVTLKPGQQYLKSSIRLKEKLERENKKAYIFIDNKIDFSNFENFPFIKVWVNTACPRIGTDDIINTNFPIINLREAFNPIKHLEDLENALS